MRKDLAKVQDIFLGKINQICNRFGLNNIMAQLYAMLYMHNRPMSLDEMASELKISKGSVSVNIRALERYGAVRRIWVKGTRKDYYEAEGDIAKVVMDRIKSMAQGRLSEVDDMLKSSIAALDSVSPQDDKEMEAVKAFKERLDKLQGLYDQAASVFELFKTSFLASESALNNKEAKA